MGISEDGINALGMGEDDLLLVVVNPLQALTQSLCADNQWKLTVMSLNVPVVTTVNPVLK